MSLLGLHSTSYTAPATGVHESLSGALSLPSQVYRTSVAVTVELPAMVFVDWPVTPPVEVSKKTVPERIAVNVHDAVPPPGDCAAGRAGEKIGLVWLCSSPVA